jgi:acyl-CoA synthetase (AMP-forming)/AMP-acid ligase II
MNNRKSLNHECGFDSSFVNVAAYLPLRSRETPDKIALAFPLTRDRLKRTAWTHLTFRQLEILSNQYANGFVQAGIKRGDRVLLMVRPSLDFVALAFSLFKTGAVPVLIDPGMGLKSLLSCIKDVEPQAIVAVGPVLAAKKLLPGIFRHVKTEIAVGPRPWWWRGFCTDDFINKENSQFKTVKTGPEELAAILFTSGSTGPAKGVEYIHSIFEAQVRQLKNFYKITPNEIEMPAFPLFALFSPALGITCVIPQMDPTKPAQVDPAKIVEAVSDFGPTNTFGSPAIWRRVADYCIANNIVLPSFKRLLLAGAPVPTDILLKFTRILSKDALACTPYGCTESLPSFNVTHHEILRPDRLEKNRMGKGVLIGKPISQMEARIIKITDDPIEYIEDAGKCSVNEIGEIIVTGPVTTRAYFKNDRANRLSKIKDNQVLTDNPDFTDNQVLTDNPDFTDNQVVTDNCEHNQAFTDNQCLINNHDNKKINQRIWHRIGDTGYIDEEGYYWFCGRKSHRLETPGGRMFTIPCEAIFNNHPDVFRSALVGPGKQGSQYPVIIIEPMPGKFPGSKEQARQFRQELLEIAQTSELTRNIRIVLFHPSFPVDIRHNAKIFREKLTVWAERKMGVTGKLQQLFWPGVLF